MCVTLLGSEDACEMPIVMHRHALCIQLRSRRIITNGHTLAGPPIDQDRRC